MVMQAMSNSRASGFMKFFIFTLLGLAVGGLALSGSFNTGNVGSNDVAKIDGKVLGIQEFDRALRLSLSRYQISPQKAYEIGITEEILTSEIRSYLLLNEAENLGIEIGKDELAARIARVVKPNALDGETLQEALDRLLSAQGLSEKAFVNSIKKEVSADLIIESIKVGFSPSNDLLAKDLYLFQRQTRDIELILFPDNEISTIKPATNEQLTHLYNATKSINYKIPEYRSINAAIFDMSEIKVEFTVTDEEVKAAYEDSLESFAVGERLVLSQTIIQDKQQADDIYALTINGEDLKTAINAIMGEEATYIENVDFEVSRMLPALNEALDSREIGKTVPPVKTTLGYHVVKLDEILPPTTKAFKSVASEIKTELLEAQKSDHLYEIATKFDDLVNDGVAFEEIAKEIDLSLSTIDFIDAKGLNKESKDGLETFDEASKSEILTSIFELDEEEAPAIMLELGNKLIALSIKEIQTPTFKPFEAVEIELANQFMDDQRRAENRAQMQTYLAEMSTGGSTFEGIASDNNKSVQKIAKIALSGTIQEPLDESSRPTIFKGKLGEYNVLNLEGGSALIKISGYDFPEINDENLKEIEDIKGQLVEETKEAAILMYLQTLNKKYPTTVNRRLLDRAYGEQEVN